MLGENVKVLISEEEIRARVAEMGRRISLDYQGREIVLVGVLKGAFVFLSDLARAIELPMVIDFLGVSSYGSSTTTTGVVRITRDLSWNIADRDVLVVEDIIDTGLTMAYLLETFKTRNPRSVKVATLLHKPARARQVVPIDYMGFSIEDKFVIGYGLDYDGRYRNLPYVAYFDPEPVGGE